MAGEGAKPILKINVDLDEWSAFQESYNAYLKTLDSSGDAWASTNKGVRQLASTFEDTEETFDGLVAKAGQDKLGKSFVTLDKSSKETAKSWVNIQKTIEKSSRDLAGMLRDGSKFSALGQFLGLGGLAVGATALFGAVRGANNSLADQNIANRKLGLKPGEEQAFDNTYQRAGGDSALLTRVANMQAMPSEWRYLQAAGVPMQDIQTKDAAALSAELLQKVGERVRTFGLPQTSLWLQGTGVDKLVDPNSARLAGSYSGNDFAEMNKQFGELVPKLAATQKQLDESTAARAKLDAALAQDALELDKALIKLNPLMIDAAGKVTNFITAFAESGELEKDVKGVVDAFDAVGTAAGWLADKLNSLFGLKGKDGDTPVYSTPAGSVGANVVQFAKNVWGFATTGSTSNWDTGVAPAVQWGGGDQNTGTVADSSNNPGNVRDASGKGFQKFATPEAGIKAADANLSAYWSKYGINTPKDIVTRWAPPSENDTDSYIKDVSKRTGLDPGKPIDMTDPKMRALLLSAMFHHEGRKGFSNLTPDQILAIENGQPLSPFDDPKAIKKVQVADDANMPEKPRTPNERTADAIRRANADNPSNKAVSDLFDRIHRGLSSFGSMLGEGGGAFARGDETTQKRIDRQGNQPMTPYQVNVRVSAPAGSSTIVSTGSIAQ